MMSDKFEQYLKSLEVIVGKQRTEYDAGMRDKRGKKIRHYSARQHFENVIEYNKQLVTCGKGLTNMFQEDSSAIESIQFILDLSNKIAEESKNYVKEFSIKK